MTEVTVKSAPKAKAPKAQPKRPTARDKGVPEQYLNPATGKFAIGRDATYKRDLINTVLDPATPKAERTKATKALERMGWTKFLDASRESRSKKAAAKAAKRQSKVDPTQAPGAGPMVDETTKANRERFAAEEASRAEPSKPAKPTAA